MNKFVMPNVTQAAWDKISEELIIERVRFRWTDDEFAQQLVKRLNEQVKLETAQQIFVPGTKHPEEDYLEMQRLSTKLGIPVPMMYVELDSRDANGNQVGHYKDRSRTFNRNYWNHLFKLFGCYAWNIANIASQLSSDATFGAGHLTQETTGAVVKNTNYNFSGQALVGACESAAGVTTNGIVVGTGTAAESFEDYALGALIANGTGAGQMSYAAMVYVQPTYSAGSKVWTMAQPRVINNNSAGTIVVGETALYTKDLANNLYFMVERNKLGATVSVLPAGQLTVTYTITLTFPA